MKVSRQDIRSALLGFLELLESTDKQASIEILELWLGQLAFLQHFVGDVSDDNRAYSAQAARHDARWRKLIGKQFPRLIDYKTHIAGVSEISTGDPLGDLAEIAGEISECIQRWDNAGADHALWYFRFSYQTHWGIRLRNLQIYLHNLH